MQRVSEMVREFRQRFAFDGGAELASGSANRESHWALIEEELEELRDAEAADDLVAVADALADIIYVAHGTAIAYGIDLDAVLAEVHRSNMTKTPNPTGKALKGSEYSPPNIAAVLAR